MPFGVGRQLVENIPQLVVVRTALFYVSRHPGPHGEIHAPPQAAASRLPRPPCQRECQPLRRAVFLSRPALGVYDSWCAFVTRNSVLNPFSPFLAISSCEAGNYLCHPVFSVLCHVFSQLVFLHIFPYIIPPSLFRSASDPSPRNFKYQRFCTDVIVF